MKYVLTVFLIFAMMGTLQAQDSTDVTFWLNTATVPDTVTSLSVVQVRGSEPPLTWDANTGGVMENAQGDLWSVTLRFPEAADVQYKFNVRTDLVQGGDGWEGSVNTASTNRELTVPADDTTLAVQFYNTTNGNDPLFRPYMETDSIEVYLRVNMQGFANFNADNQFVGVRGAFPESGGWSTNILLSQESAGDVADQFTYPANQFWSGVTRIDPNMIPPGDTLAYKFVTLPASDPTADVDSWEDNIPMDREFTVGSTDTTVEWVFFDDAAPIRASNEDTVKLTFVADMTRAISSRGFTPGDTVFARVGFAGTANLLTDIQMFNIEGTTLWTGSDTVVATLGGLIEYDYRLTKLGQEVRESFFDFDFEPEPGQEGRSERRRAPIVAAGAAADVNDTTPIEDTNPDEFSQRRQPFFPNNEPISQDVLVTFEVDMRPAYWELLLSSPTDTLFDIQGGRDIFDPQDVIDGGVWINGLSTGGWQTWGGVLEDDSTRIMYDDGTNGDRVAGDTVFTRQYLFSPDSLTVGSKGRLGQVFKFGIIGGDNEGGFGNNHVANVDDSENTFTVFDQFGSIDPKKYDHWDFINMRPILNPTSVGDDVLPNQFALDQNYPNPFNPETSIRYNLGSASEVKLTVFNIIGQKVATIVNEKQPAGNYIVKWDGRNDFGQSVSTGLYLYKLETANFVETKKMLLLK